MKKYLVETYYTCTFKTVHSLNDLNDQELAKIDTRTDGEVEVIDVKLNNRKTKKIGAEKSNKKTENKITKPISKNLSEKITNTNKILSIVHSLFLSPLLPSQLSCHYQPGLPQKVLASFAKLHHLLSRYLGTH